MAAQGACCADTTRPRRPRARPPARPGAPLPGGAARRGAGGADVRARRAADDVSGRARPRGPAGAGRRAAPAARAQRKKRAGRGIPPSPVCIYFIVVGILQIAVCNLVEWPEVLKNNKRMSFSFSHGGILQMDVCYGMVWVAPPAIRKGLAGVPYAKCPISSI